jgi:vancomycin resistance protein YoaR
VTNIQRIAKSIDRTIIAPGQQFSLNGLAGERTLAKGYVEAPFIAGNKIEPSVGGGVSQFSTTMYNAAYFAGLQIDAHQPHSLYIDRYPPGRESTLNFPDIDMKWTNDTDVPILIRTYADDAGVTVTLYGDNGGRKVTAEPGSREPNPGGNFSITVTRKITYPGGRVVTQPSTTKYANEVVEEAPQE